MLGIAKDGLLIIGPYIDGKKVDCKRLDQCNGITLKDGSYVYVFTDTYPYTIGCFGPGMPQYYSASCSANTCLPHSQAPSLKSAFMVPVIAILLMFI